MGFLTRQFAFLAMSYYYEDGSDPTNKGIEIKAKDAIGRTTTDGKIVEENNSNDLIKVRSLVTSTYKNKFAITPDMLSNLFHYKDGSRVGIDLMTSTTEGLTQSSLSLKHGGALFEVEPNGNIYAKEDCSVQVNEDWILIKNSVGKLLVFPKSRNFIQSYSPSNTYKKGELIGATYKMNTPVYRLDCVISLCGARATNPNKRFAKNSVLSTDCYASNSGIIKYKKDNEGFTHVYIDEVEYQYNPDSLYYFPEGALVKKYDRICSGVLSMQQLMQHEHKYIEIFYHFRNQMTELFPDVAKELFEFLFVLIVKKQEDGFSISSIISSISNSESFYTSVAFGNARNRFKKLTPEGIEFKSDTLTQVTLSLIANNKIL